MTAALFAAFDEFRTAFRRMAEEWSAAYSAVLLPLQREAAAGGYEVETPIVYNTSLDKVTADSRIKLIIVGDNPGKKEQMANTRAYMAGASGAMAEGFFRRNPALGIDFRKDAVILNKTPIHTAKTVLLRRLMADGRAAEAVRESQVWMAEHTARLHQLMGAGAGRGNGGGEGGSAGDSAGGGGVKLWVVGYGELRRGGVFDLWRQAFAKAYSRGTDTGGARQDVMVYQHFSMNRFAIDFRSWQAMHKEQDTYAALQALGRKHCQEILGL